MAAARGEGEAEDVTPTRQEPRRMLDEAQVLAIIPVGRTTLYNMMRSGGFPKGTYVSANRRLWFADEIARWQNAISESNPHFNPHRGRGGGRRPRNAAASNDRRPAP
jgi:prophage regulatory protein